MTWALKWRVIFDKGAVMALRSNITKSIGLTAALEELNMTAESVVGIGDTENDLSFLKICGLSAAVANALTSLKRSIR